MFSSLATANHRNWSRSEWENCGRLFFFYYHGDASGEWHVCFEVYIRNMWYMVYIVLDYSWSIPEMVSYQMGTYLDRPVDLEISYCAM
jgi:hypothetical protein